MLIEQLQRQSGLSRGKLLRLAATATHRYKVYEIEKRSGGSRTIEHPSKEIKSLQRWLNATLFNKIPVHSSATAYIKGASIRENASRHVNTNFTLRMDFKDFFPSFGASNVKNFLEMCTENFDLQLNQQDIDFSVKIVSRNDRLTIGAPTSPSLTNAMMFEFDRELSSVCARKGLIYTRYADDIFVSSRTPGQLNEVHDEIYNISSNFRFADLKINSKKTVFLSRKYSRSITGLVITSDNKISLGRDRKREIKTLTYMYSIGSLPIERISYLQGMLAFARDSDPEFFIAISEKFGSAVIKRITKGI